ncbi:DUF1415 domain-containing protein [Legionella brunensis]|uniref:DUF1415 domain-containing protein n=1 Tax=Legionella brunensis TaxID=29422 RepID=A0A0W0SSZ9_9GAMM|nr:DUF1415 domain-containing protein [Legionella brunensis]KTC86462.1 hypothetical protein Lbru_0403 [Legionella brunensis]
MANKTELIVEQTQKWLHSFVVKFNLCPFANREIKRGSLRLKVSQAKKTHTALKDYFSEINLLDHQREIETTLLIFPCLFNDFFDYLDFVELCEKTLEVKGYVGIYQIASFHPDYCFSHEDYDDVSNYTNRSPYPIIHLLREESLEKAISAYDSIAEIPQKNINTLRKLGLEKVKRILRHCTFPESKAAY